MHISNSLAQWRNARAKKKKTIATLLIETVEFYNAEKKKMKKKKILITIVCKN